MILVFGSINLDLIFDMEALPAPGETRLARAMRTEPGGKGANQAVAAAKDGAQVALYGAVGRDAFANPAQAGLESADVDVWGVEAVAGATGIASIVTDKAGRNAIAVAPGANLKARQDKVPDEFLDDATIELHAVIPLGEEQRLLVVERAIEQRLTAHRVERNVVAGQFGRAGNAQLVAEAREDFRDGGAIAFAAAHLFAEGGFAGGAFGGRYRVARAWLHRGCALVGIKIGRFQKGASLRLMSVSTLS